MIWSSLHISVDVSRIGACGVFSSSCLIGRCFGVMALLLASFLFKPTIKSGCRFAFLRQASGKRILKNGEAEQSDLLLLLSHATDRVPVELTGAVDTGATTEDQGVGVATTVGSRRPVEAARPAIVELTIAVAAGVDAEER